MSRAAPQFCSLSAANLQQFGFNSSIRRTAALFSPAPSIPTPYFYVRSACDGLRMMAMRPLHRAGADTGCAVPCAALPWRAIHVGACIALAVFQIRRYATRRSRRFNSEH